MDYPTGPGRPAGNARYGAPAADGDGFVVAAGVRDGTAAEPDGRTDPLGVGAGVGVGVGVATGFSTVL